MPMRVNKFGLKKSLICFWRSDEQFKEINMNSYLKSTETYQSCFFIKYVPKSCQVDSPSLKNHQNLIETMSLLGRNLRNFAYLNIILYNCNHVNNSTRLKAWHVGKIYCFKIVCNGWYFWNSNMCFCSQLRYLLCVYYRTKKFCRDWRLAHYFVVAFEFMFGFNVLFFLSYSSYRQRRAQTKKM